MWSDPRDPRVRLRRHLATSSTTSLKHATLATPLPLRYASASWSSRSRAPPPRALRPLGCRCTQVSHASGSSRRPTAPFPGGACTPATNFWPLRRIRQPIHSSAAATLQPSTPLSWLGNTTPAVLTSQMAPRSTCASSSCHQEAGASCETPPPMLRSRFRPCSLTCTARVRVSWRVLCEMHTASTLTPPLHPRRRHCWTMSPPNPSRSSLARWY